MTLKENFNKEFEEYVKARSMMANLYFIHTNTLYGAGGPEVMLAKDKVVEEFNNREKEISEKKSRLQNMLEELISKGESIEEEVKWIIEN